MVITTNQFLLHIAAQKARIQAAKAAAEAAKAKPANNEEQVP